MSSFLKKKKKMVSKSNIWFRIVKKVNIQLLNYNTPFLEVPQTAAKFRLLSDTAGLLPLSKFGIGTFASPKPWSSSSSIFFMFGDESDRLRHPPPLPLPPSCFFKACLLIFSWIARSVSSRFRFAWKIPFILATSIIY